MAFVRWHILTNCCVEIPFKCYDLTSTMCSKFLSVVHCHLFYKSKRIGNLLKSYNMTLVTQIKVHTEGWWCSQIFNVRKTCSQKILISVIVLSLLNTQKKSAYPQFCKYNYNSQIFIKREREKITIKIVYISFSVHLFFQKLVINVQKRNNKSH